MHRQNGEFDLFMFRHLTDNKINLAQNKPPVLFADSPYRVHSTGLIFFRSLDVLPQVRTCRT
jgi:hypothetical protein